jgi:hypothetical protein
MKKIFFILIMISLCSSAFALPDKVTPSEYSGASQQISSKATTVTSVNVSYIGANAGDYVQLQDSIGAGGTIRFTCVASASAGTCVAPYNTTAAYFGTGVYMNTSNGKPFKVDIQSF